MKACREVCARIPAAIEGELAIEQVFALERHCERCGPCGRRYAAARALDAALARLPDPPVERIDVERQVQLVRAEIDRREPRQNRRAARPQLARWLPAAAAVLIALGLFAERLVRRPIEADRTALDTASTAAESPSEPKVATVAAPENDAAPIDEPEIETVAPTAMDSAAVARLADVRAEVREHLRASAADLPAADADAGLGSAHAFAADFAVRTDALARAGWPILRIVEGSLDDPDLVVARAALRWLGLRGDRLAIARVRAALARPDLAEDAVRALADAGDAGLEGLAAALEIPRLRTGARAALVARGDAAAAAVIERDVLRGARAGGRSRVPTRPAAGPSTIDEDLDDLARIGAPSLPSLLRLGADPDLTESALAALERAPGASEALGALVAGSTDGDAGLDAFEPELLVRALGRLKPEASDDAVPDPIVNWLVVACETRALVPAVLTSLAAYETPAAFGALVALHAGGKIADADIERALQAAFADGGAAARALALRAIEGGAEHLVPEPSHLYAALVAALAPSFDASSRPACAPALAVLARSSALSDSDRRSALLVCGEIGRPADAEELALTLRALEPADKDLRAACILSIHALAGVEAVARALELAPRSNRDRVLALLEARESRGRPSTTLVRLTRELEHELAYPNP